MGGTDFKDREHGGRGSLFGLRELREAKGIGFREVVESTKVSPLMLEAIEGNDFSKLPEPVYTRSFLRSYAALLDIDPDELLARYDAYCSSQDTVKNQYEHLRKRRHKPSIVPKITAIVLVLCLAALAFYLFWGQKEIWFPGEPRQPVSHEEDSVVVEDEDRRIQSAVPSVNGRNSTDSEYAAVETPPKEPEKVLLPVHEISVEEVVSETAEAAGETVPESSPGEAVQELVLEIRAAELTWVQITRNGAPPEQIYLQQGDSIKRHASSRFDVIIGNAGGAEVLFQGSSLGKLGRHGEVVSFSLPGDAGGR